MGTFAIAAFGAVIVAAIYEAQPGIGAPLIGLVLLGLLFAAYRMGDLKSATVNA